MASARIIRSITSNRRRIRKNNLTRNHTTSTTEQIKLSLLSNTSDSSLNKSILIRTSSTKNSYFFFKLTNTSISNIKTITLIFIQSKICIYLTLIKTKHFSINRLTVIKTSGLTIKSQSPHTIDKFTLIFFFCNTLGTDCSCTSKTSTRNAF